MAPRLKGPGVCFLIMLTTSSRDQLEWVSPDYFDGIQNRPNRYRRHDCEEYEFNYLKTDIFSLEIMSADIADGATPCRFSDSKNSDDVWRVHDDENSASPFVMSCHKAVKAR